MGQIFQILQEGTPGLATSTGKQTSVLCSNSGSGVQVRVTSALEGCARIVAPQLGLNGSVTHGPKLNCAAQVGPQPQPIRTSLITVLRNHLYSPCLAGLLPASELLSGPHEFSTNPTATGGGWATGPGSASSSPGSLGIIPSGATYCDM